MNCLHLNRCQPLTGDDYALLRQNPDRGFRLEAYLRLGSGSAVFHPRFSSPGLYLEKQLVFYREEDCKLVQLYVYLSEYLDRPLDAHAFSQLETYLETLRQKRLRALLRFAYEEEADRKKRPRDRSNPCACRPKLACGWNSTKRLYTKPLPPFRQASTVHGANGILQSTITAAKN